MKILNTLLMMTLCPLLATSVVAQTPAAETARNINQQERIEKGLESGALSTKEAATLEKNQAHIEHMEANALHDGTVSAQEKQRINSAQNKTSAAIYQEKHDAQTANPNSVSSMRMQEDVHRNVNQQKRIHEGIHSGALTNEEAAKLERGQAHVNGHEARAGADGHLGSAEQNKIQRAKNHQSHRIHHEKLDKQVKH